MNKISSKSSELTEVEILVLRSGSIIPFLVTRAFPGLRQKSLEVLTSVANGLLARGFLHRMHGGFVLTQKGWHAVRTH